MESISWIHISPKINPSFLILVHHWKYGHRLQELPPSASALQIIIKNRGKKLYCAVSLPSYLDLMLGAYWHLHQCIDSSHFVCCVFVARWAAEQTSSANKDTYYRAPPLGSVYQISPGLAHSLPASVSSVYLLFHHYSSLLSS